MHEDLLGEVVMEPEKVAPYFGTVEKPECHMLYNVTTMADTWHTVATRNVSLLKRQLDIVNFLPKEYVFLNYLRCRDDIGWGLDYGALMLEGIGKRSHKKYLNDYFQGYAGDSNSRGEKLIGLFNFSEYDKTAWINETDGDYVELITGNEIRPIGVNIPAYGFCYMKRISKI